MLVVSKIFGGLGNQMFQYAAGRALSIKYNCDLKLDIYAFDRYKIHNGYELSRYKINANIATSTEIKALSGRQSRVENFIRRKTGWSKKTHLVEESGPITSAFFEINSSVYLDGYWQSWRYFESIASIIRSELLPTERLNGLNMVLSNEMSNNNSVSIHIRRGDYIDNKAASKMHGFIGLEYYIDAISELKKTLETPIFYVFSDDMDWVKKNLILPESTKYISHNTGESSFEDIRLMSFCRANIIANSSFSWWAAWLNPRVDKIVYYPQHWFVNKNKDTAELCPPEWITV